MGKPDFYHPEHGEISNIIELTYRYHNFLIEFNRPEIEQVLSKPLSMLIGRPLDHHNAASDAEASRIVLAALTK
jgi:hypothetical protein